MRSYREEAAIRAGFAAVAARLDAALSASRAAVGGLIVATAVTLAYTEEVFADAGPAAVDGEAMGDVFGLGSRSLFVWRQRRAFPLEAVEGDRLGGLVLAGLRAAGRALPEPYRAAAASPGPDPADGAGPWTDSRAT